MKNLMIHFSAKGCSPGKRLCYKHAGRFAGGVGCEPQRGCGAIAFVVTLLFSPETRGKELVPQLTLVERPA